MIGPEGMTVDPGAQAPVQRLRHFDPKNVGPHEYTAILYVLRRMGMNGEEIDRLLKHRLGLKFQGERISADDPRTGDMIELGDNRVVYVNERIEINDPMTWKALCMDAHPDAVYMLAGGR